MRVVRFRPKSVAWRIEICWSRPKLHRQSTSGFSAWMRGSKVEKSVVAERMAQIGQHLDAHIFPRGLEAVHHLVAIA